MANLRAVSLLHNEAARLFNEYLNAKTREDADKAKEAYKQAHLAILKLSPVMFEEAAAQQDQLPRSHVPASIILPAAQQKSWLN